MEKMKFKIHLPNLLKEIVDCALPKRMGLLYQPINQLRIRLVELAELGQEIDDPRLHLWLYEMALYSQGDPQSKDYDKNIHTELLQKVTELKGGR